MPTPFTYLLLILAAQIGLQSAAGADTSGQKIGTPIFVPQNHPDHWISIHSRQTVQTRINGYNIAKPAEWLVDEHLSLAEQISYSHHSNPSTGESFVLLAHGLRNYYSSGHEFEADCRPDHRQDRLTLFPWRHSDGAGTPFEREPLVLGVGALWLNALSLGANCQVQMGAEELEGQQLNCSLTDDPRRVRLDLLFDWPLPPNAAEGENDGEAAFARLREAHVDHWRLVQLGFDSMVQEVRVMISVVTMARSSVLEEPLMTKVRDLVKLCTRSIETSEAIFPSLLHTLAKSPHRNYKFSYNVGLVDTENSSPDELPRVKEKFNVQEYFSYELERQSIFETAHGEGPESGAETDAFYSLFAFQNQDFSQTLAYRSHKNSHCVVVPEIEDPLLAMSRLSRRTLSFVHGSGEEEGDRRKSDLHSGVLKGLGALLMNVADIRGKSAPVGATLNMGTRFNPKSVVEWVLEDEVEGLRFEFYLVPKAKDELSHHSLEIGDLLKVRVKKICPPEKPGTGQPGGPPCALLDVLMIDVLGFYTNIEPAKLDDVFLLPAACPSTARFKLNREFHQDGSGKMNLNADNEVPDYEFPILEQFTELTKDYGFASEWSLGGGNKLQVDERQALNLEDKIINRIDFRKLKGEITSFSIYYNRSVADSTRNPIYRVEGDKCQQMGSPVYWLEMLSFRPLGSANPLYGVHALWSLASESPYMEFLGQSESQAAWKLVDDPNLVDLSAIFTFVFPENHKTAPNMAEKIRLKSVEIDTSQSDRLRHLNPIKIENIQLTLGTGGATESHFALPSGCYESGGADEPEDKRNDDSPGQDIGDDDATRPVLKFPSFSQRFGGYPNEVTFAMRYNYRITMSNISLTFEALEVFNKPQLLGRLDLRHEQQYVRLWMEGEHTFMEQPASGQCKQVRQLHRFLYLDPFINIIEGDQLSLIDLRASNFAAANLWELFSSRIDLEGAHDRTVPGRVEYSYSVDPQGDHRAEWSVIGPTTSVKFSFKHDGDAKGGNLQLQTIGLVSQADNQELVTLEMLEISNRLIIPDMVLPGECSGRLAKEFPRVGDLLTATNGHLHMRSEITTNEPLGGHSTGGHLKSKFYLLDEHFDRGAGAFRSRSTGLEPNFDYLIYNRTREFFDLSDGLECRNRAANPNSPVGTMAADWILDNLFSASSDGPFHGPLSLWLFAELAPGLTQEMVYDEIGLLDLGDSYRVQQWLALERWRVFQPFEESLSYTLQFSAETREQEPGARRQQLSRWTVLDRAETWDWRSSIAGERAQLIVAEVVYGRDSFAGQELRIPKGLGCRRGPLFKEAIKRQTLDLMVFDSLSPVEFEYEASLSVAEEEAGGQLVPRPVIHSGYFGRCPGSWNWFPFGVLKVHHQRTHHLNGTRESRKWVLSNETPGAELNHRRLLDERRGLCSIWQEHESPSELLRLDFSWPGKQEEPIVIDDSLMRLLGTESYELDQIQQFNLTTGANGGDYITEVVYEKRQSKIKLNSQLSGPTSVVRTYHRESGDAQNGGPYYNHHSVRLEAIVLGKAHLTLRLKRLGFRNCIDILARANAEDCHQSSELAHDPSVGRQRTTKLRSFTLKMIPINQNPNWWDDSAPFKVLLRQAFVGALLTLSPDLRPMQIGGRMSVDPHPVDQSVRVRFILLEPPAAIEFFRKIPQQTIRPSRSADVGQALIRLLDTRFGCSEWCDSMRCVAFSYCHTDRSCSIVRHNSSQPQPQMDDQDLANALGFQLTKNPFCDYYFAPGARRRPPLKGVIEEITKRAANFNSSFQSKQDQTFEILVNLPQNHIRLVASEFTEMREDVDLFDQLAGEEEQRDEPSTAADLQSAYTLLRAQRALEPHRLPDTLVSQVLYVTMVGECFESCQQQSCQVFSYCSRQHLCTILSNITDGPTLQTAIGDLQSDPDQWGSCNIFSTDYLLDYHQFEGTTKPVAHAHLLANISALECAALCELGLGSTAGDQVPPFDCLSFDYCINNSTKTTECHLQKMHILMDSFDESILEQKNGRELEASKESESLCTHYSKSLLADFQQFKGKKFSQHSSIVFKGTELDQCALICRRDDTCLAFEHCFRELEKPPNACYIQRELVNGTGLNRASELKIAEQLIPEVDCSVYRVRRTHEEFKVNFNAESGSGTILGIFEPNFVSWFAKLDEGNYRLAINVFVFIGTMFSAMVVGSLVHIMYIMITGDRLPMFQ